jgi:hypothetical protein
MGSDGFKGVPEVATGHAPLPLIPKKEKINVCKN